MKAILLKQLSSIMWLNTLLFYKAMRDSSSIQNRNYSMKNKLEINHKRKIN